LGILRVVSKDAPSSDAPGAPPDVPSSARIGKDHERDEHSGALAAAVRIISGLTLLSRFAGLARDIITARIFGDTPLGSAFRSAYALPNFFRRLFGEGALSAAFLPEYTTLSRDDPAMASKLASLVLAVQVLVTGGLTLVMELGLIAALIFAPGTEERRLALGLTILMLPMMPMVCTTAILGGMLQAHGRFGPPAAAPILLNLFQIVAAALFVLGLIHDRVTAAYIIGGAAVAASVAQVAWSLLALRGKVVWSRAWDAAMGEGRIVLKRFMPVVIGLGALQISSLVDLGIAMWPNFVGPTIAGRPFPLDLKSYGLFSYSQTLYQFPLGVFGIAVATAVFPMLSRHASDPDLFVQTLRRGLRLSLFIGLPATVGLLLVRHDLVAVIFGGTQQADGGAGGGGGGGFSADGVARSAALVAGFAPAVWAYSLNHVLTRAFYARGDTGTPMRVSVASVVLNLVLTLILIWPLREAGMAWATAICAMLQCGALAVLLRTRHGVHAFDGVAGPTARAFTRIAGAAVIMGAAVWAIQNLWQVDQRWSARAIRLTASVVVGAGVYGGIAVFLRLPELKWLTQRGTKGGGTNGSAGMSFD
jgi:putative peptidoglycan lipid II flippase